MGENHPSPPGEKVPERADEGHLFRPNPLQQAPSPRPSPPRGEGEVATNQAYLNVYGTSLHDETPTAAIG